MLMSITSTVISSMNKRKAEMIDMKTTASSSKVELYFLHHLEVGYQNQFLTETGSGVINRIFTHINL